MKCALGFLEILLFTLHTSPVLSTITEVIDLTAESCSNTTTFHNIKGSFQAYSVYIDMDEGMDEFKPIVVTCGLNAAVPEECKELVEGTIENISISMNGTIKDYMYSDYYRPNIKQFGSALHFEQHEKAEVKCITILSGGGVLVSNEKTISDIDELHPFMIFPAKQDVTVGHSYTLTCKTDVTRALDDLSWTLWNPVDGFETTVSCADDDRFSCGTVKRTATNLPGSVLTVSTSELEKNVTSTPIEFTYRCNSAVNHTHQHKMLGEARVTVHPKTSNAVGIGLGVTAGILVLGVIIAAAVIIFKRSKLTTVMTYGKLEETNA